MSKPDKSTRSPSEAAPSEASPSDTSLSDTPSGPSELQFDPISPFCHDVLSLFRGPFAEVRFPDLHRESLEDDAQQLLAAQQEVESLEHALDQARQRTRERSAVLTASASRALAYAKVYASGQPSDRQSALDRALFEVRTTEARPESRALDAARSDSGKKRRVRKDHGTGELLAIGPQENVEEQVAAAE
jgi:hypothetical protein